LHFRKILKSIILLYYIILNTYLSSIFGVDLNPYYISLLRNCRSFVEFYREKFRSAITANSDSIEHSRAGHCFAIMGDNNKLGLLGKLLQHIAVFA